MPSSPVNLIILGAGNRGRVYADYALRYPDLARVAAVAEPRRAYREAFAEVHALSEEQLFTDWQQLAARTRFADAVVIATPDRQHAEPAAAFAAQGYSLLLEKPIAPAEADCLQVAEAVRKAGVLCAVGHVLRYTPYTQALKRLLAEGAVGDIVSVQHLEPVGYWHIAHSYVRGNWRSEAGSAPLLLAKSCHDLDWLSFIVGSSWARVSSFGNLKHFTKANKPPEAAEAVRCLDCAFEPKCPYSAKKIYLRMLEQGTSGMPLTALTLDVTRAGILKALEHGSYGRCVYECDNDVVDHQVTNLLFENGVTASFTVTGFSETRPRQTRIFGTEGELTGDGSSLTLYDFLTETKRVLWQAGAQADTLRGHGGGDEGLMAAFVRAVAEGQTEMPGASFAEALDAHLLGFAAERSRLSGQTVSR